MVTKSSDVGKKIAVLSGYRNCDGTKGVRNLQSVIDKVEGKIWGQVHKKSLVRDALVRYGFLSKGIHKLWNP